MREKMLFNCCLIGEGNLLIECAEILLQKKYQIEGILSLNPIVKQWANANEISNLQNLQELLQLIKTVKCDYLFSIVNHAILSSEIINSVGKAINYHDALLPSYAGLNAAAWAIINGETQHGITWHEITAEIDTGNLLKQVKIDLESSETALTLNAKCYQAAIAAFRELVVDLASEAVTSTPQNLQQRSYFARHQKPQNLGIIDFEQSAAVIDNLVRGLDFGNYPNPLTTAKLLLNVSNGLDYVIVNKVKKLATKSQQLPGTIIEIQSDQLILATGSQDIALQAITNKHGEVSSIAELVANYQLTGGQQLPLVTKELSTEIVKLASKLAPGESYWRKQLTQWQPLNLPGVKKNITSATFENYRRVKLPLSQKVIDFIEKTYGVTGTSEVIIAIFAIYLARLSGNQQITLGFEFSDQQTLAKLNEVIAPWFASCVPGNISIAPTENLTTVIEAIAKRLKLNQQYQTYATDLIARYPQLASKTIDFTVTVTQNAESVSGDLILSIFASEYYWLYNAKIFSEEQITTMLEQLKTLVEGIVNNESLTVSQLPLISPSEVKQVWEWNQTSRDYPDKLCLHQLFEARVVEDPEAIAVVCQGNSLTRRELNRQANQLAHHLQQLRVQPETLVGVCLERSLEMAIAVFAILKAGGAYVPLDPNYPAARLNYLLGDARVDVLLTQSKLLERLPATSAQIICLDQSRETKVGSDTNPLSSVNSHNLAYVIYTSGSTGNPKGVAIEHHSAVNTLCDLEQRFAIQPQDRVLAVSSLSFDLSVYDLFGVLGSGGTAIIPQPATCPDPEHWLELITQEQVTIWNSAPALLELLVNYLITYNQQLPPSLRLILLSGDRINPNLITQLQNFNPQLQIISLGGATEASIWSIYYPIPQNWPAGKTIPYGRPLDNQSFYILDSEQQLAPIGAIGELYIGGIGVARGYLHRRELTKEKFINPPALSRTLLIKEGRGERLYKTGDLGRYLEDGNIEFLGRIDNQVKIRGVRIELGEIEAALLQCREIQETLVTVNSDHPERSTLVAYSILKPNSTLTSQQLRNLLKTQLPEHAIPSTFIFLDTFPLTPNGKVDLKALLKTPTKELKTKDNLLQPQDPLECKLSQIWSQILHVRPIARDDNFFDLGGNSLLALRMFGQIQKTLGINLPLATLFAAPTIAQLANLMLDQDWSAPWSSLVSIQPHGTKPPFFCVHPLGGHVLCYQPLAEALGKDQPFYGLQARGLDGRPISLTSLEEMAADYVQEIKLIQPQGPYFLGGHSFGGFVAYEMARQLEQQGDKVAMVALIDCLGPNYVDKHTFAQKMQIHLNNLTQLSPPRALNYVQERVDFLLRLKVLKLIQKRYFKIANLFLSRKQRPLTVRNRYDILLNYNPQTYGGKITLLRARVRDVKGYSDPNGGWGGLALGGVDVYEIPGDHITMLVQPKLAQILTEQINDTVALIALPKKTDRYPSRHYSE
jgi:amino acid adenylation domain-containing protein